jgi:hypothetical protein
MGLISVVDDMFTFSISVVRLNTGMQHGAAAFATKVRLDIFLFTIAVCKNRYLFYGYKLFKVMLVNKSYAFRSTRVSIY